MQLFFTTSEFELIDIDVYMCYHVDIIYYIPHICKNNELHILCKEQTESMLRYDYKKYDGEILPIRQDTYAVKDGYSLPINIFVPREENQNNRYAVLCIHGGGWGTNLKAGEKWDGYWMRHQAKYYSMLGYYAFEISYRPCGVGSTDVCDLVCDVSDAMKYIRNRLTPEFGIEKLISIGDSAGGHLVLCLALDDDITMRPDICIALNPVSDLLNDKWIGNCNDINRRLTVSPYHNVIRTDTKFYIMHGDADTVVAPSDSARFYEKLIDRKNTAKIEYLPNAQHAFILYGYTARAEDIDIYMQKTVDFINENL